MSDKIPKVINFTSKWKEKKNQWKLKKVKLNCEDLDIKYIEVKIQTDVIEWKYGKSLLNLFFQSVGLL